MASLIARSSDGSQMPPVTSCFIAESGVARSNHFSFVKKLVHDAEGASIFEKKHEAKTSAWTFSGCSAANLIAIGPENDSASRMKGWSHGITSRIYGKSCS